MGVSAPGVQGLELERWGLQAGHPGIHGKPRHGAWSPESEAGGDSGGQILSPEGKALGPDLTHPQQQMDVPLWETHVSGSPDPTPTGATHAFSCAAASVAAAIFL